MDTGLLLMCVIAFTAVFLLLTVLSILMSALTAIFPGKAAPAALPAAEAETDAAVLAAITTTLNQLYPGASVTKIEEVK